MLQKHSGWANINHLFGSSKLSSPIFFSCNSLALWTSLLNTVNSASVRFQLCRLNTSLNQRCLCPVRFYTNISGSRTGVPGLNLPCTECYFCSCTPIQPRKDLFIFFKKWAGWGVCGAWSTLKHPKCGQGTRHNKANCRGWSRNIADLLTLGWLVNMLYHKMDAHAFGIWQILEMTTTGRECVCKEQTREDQTVVICVCILLQNFTYPTQIYRYSAYCGFVQ